MNSSPQITVLIPAYNAGKYIGDAINSVLVQSFTDFELLIVNDGSTDHTEETIRSFSDPRIVLINREHAGVSAALNAGLDLAKSRYIARFDADDICMPHRLEKQLGFLESHPDYVLAGSDAEYILENGDHLFNFTCIGHSHEEVMKKLYFYCPFIHSGVMYRKDDVMKAGGYSLHAHNFEDYLLWTQLAKQGKLCNLPETLIKVRFNPNSVTIDEKWRGNRFRKLKRSVIKRGSITRDEGNELLAIIKNQDVQKIKQGSYHALCGKKFLTDNYQPKKARKHIKEAIQLNTLRFDNYALFIASYLPERMIRWLHKKSPNKL